MPVLEFLNGRELDIVSFNWIETLRPSFVRVIKSGSEVTCDAWHWRVTIYLRENSRTIDRIEQEVTVGLNFVDHGADLRNRFGV